MMNPASNSSNPYIIAAYLIGSLLPICYAIWLIRHRKQLRLLKSSVAPHSKEGGE